LVVLVGYNGIPSYTIYRLARYVNVGGARMARSGSCCVKVLSIRERI